MKRLVKNDGLSDKLQGRFLLVDEAGHVREEFEVAQQYRGGEVAYYDGDGVWVLQSDLMHVMATGTLKGLEQRFNLEVSL